MYVLLLLSLKQSLLDIVYYVSINKTLLLPRALSCSLNRMIIRVI